MMQNFSKDAWIRHEVFVLAVVILICSCSGKHEQKGLGGLTVILALNGLNIKILEKMPFENVFCTVFS